MRKHVGYALIRNPGCVLSRVTKAVPNRLLRWPVRLRYHRIEPIASLTKMHTNLMSGAVAYDRSSGRVIQCR